MASRFNIHCFKKRIKLHVFMLPPVTLIICILYDIAVQFTDTILSSSFAITLVSIPVVFRI